MENNVNLKSNVNLKNDTILKDNTTHKNDTALKNDTTLKDNTNTGKCKVNWLQDGYISVPRILFRQRTEAVPLTEEKALGLTRDEVLNLIILMSCVNYKDCVLICPNGKKITCCRGEAVRSITTWAKLFECSRGSAEHFFEKMCHLGYLRQVRNGTLRYHFELVGYKEFLDQRMPLSEKPIRVGDESDPLFDTFMTRYHELLQKPKTDKARVMKAWLQLTPQEQELAIKNIEQYAYHQDDRRFILHAANYLANKAFLNEYF